MSIHKILEHYRKISFSERDKGNRFERLIQAYLQTDPQYSYKLKNVWLWNEFPYRADFGGQDTGIDLVALTNEGDYWAIQCKCYKEGATIDKPAIDSFLSTSSREFKNEHLQTVGFSNRLWIDTTGKTWGSNAEQAIRNQNPPVQRIGLSALYNAPVDWEKLENGIRGENARFGNERDLRPHQKEALEKTIEHFKTHTRGKLIMACGTGKTFTSLRIAEEQTQGKGLILFLVPSIALLGQTLREWTTFAKEPINAVCICSDAQITRKTSKNEDSDGSSVVDLALPASTDVKNIVRQFHQIGKKENKGMTVVFSTYQSIEVIAKAQKEICHTYPHLDEFDLIICDEAHRTTGVSLAGEDESAFTKVHDDQFIKAKKRVYMTATPRLYSDDVKSKAAQSEALLCSMDDEKLYGQEMYHIGFGKAVEMGLLTDYKVLILTLNEKDVPPAVQRMISDAENEINTDDISKLIGCVNALSKQILGDEGIIKETDPEPMRRAVAFCPNISASKKITTTFNTATNAYTDALPSEKKSEMVSVAAKHIDGTMAAPQRDNLLTWLKAETTENECRILTNVRCLSEGVDVPSLDAVLFLSARNSQVDVVQSVGRVMRLAPNKKYGYIIIPVLVPSEIDAATALDDNERYKVVWTVLNALRAHDDRFNATVNKIELNKSRPMQILVGRPEYSFDNEGQPTSVREEQGAYSTAKDLNQQLGLQFAQLQGVVFARMVQKVGDRRYWEQWAKNVAEIAERQIERINRLINSNKAYKEVFANFLGGLQKNINPSISQQEAVEMLSQHIITKPVFEALFEDYSFVKSNPISVSMQSMLDLLQEEAIEKDTETLHKFYESVKMRASGIDNAEGKQRIVIELYDKFFKTAFPKMVEKLGIVYTPVEVVDFILHSVNDILKKEFSRSISDENIHILDPFTGTGTFITRLLQSGLIEKKDLLRKYKHEIHANEIVLLAYYIAAINIENAFHWGMGYEGLKHGGKGTKNTNNYGKNKFIQGANSLAGSYELGGNDLSSNQNLSEGGDVWLDQSNEESSCFHTRKYSGGLREKFEEGIPTILGDSKRLIDGVGNTFFDSTKDSLLGGDASTENTDADTNSGENIDSPTQILSSGIGEDGVLGNGGLGNGGLGIENKVLSIEDKKLSSLPPVPHTLTPVPTPVPHTLTPIPTPAPYTLPPTYIPFEGICLTDTFQLGENDNNNELFAEMFPQNSERVKNQRKAPLRVIIGNPPYSVGQKSANDNAQNQSYPTLDKDIANTYAKESAAGLNKSLYDAYIKAFRWSTNNLDENGGIICFVSNGAWLDGNSTDGFRKSLEKEFSSIYVFNLRGNQRTSGELSRKEGGKIFGSGSRTPIAITLLVKNPAIKAQKATIYYNDIGDYLNREEKLAIVKKYQTMGSKSLIWNILHPNEHGDWVSQRNNTFDMFIPLEPEKKFDVKSQTFFNTYVIGIATNRDAWTYNYSTKKLLENMKRMISFYNNQVDAYLKESQKEKIKIDDFIDGNLLKIKWTVNLKADAQRGVNHKLKLCNRICLYRPFNKENLYYDRPFIERPGLSSILFPNEKIENYVICVTGIGASKEFSILITNSISSLDSIEKSQGFPLYYYEEREKQSKSLFDEGGESEYIRRDGVSDFIWERAKKQYGKNVSKEDIFYYVYGFLHSPEYREKFANDLKKMLPRLPLLEDVRDFWAFSKAGRKLAELHIDYEKVAPYEGCSVEGLENSTLYPNPQTLFLVEKMRFPKKDQKETILYNSKITISHIPAKAYQYVVNGKSAIEWIMERYAVSTHKESGITNNPNDWATEVGNPRYILDLLLSVINVSVQTVDIVAGLPKVVFE